MRIILNNSSMQPIFEQIVAQIKGQIMNGSLNHETLLPSVRSLSKDLRISALTVKKAYDALEQEGFIVTVHGKGSYIAQTNAQLLNEERRKKVETQLELAVREGRSCGMTDDEIKDMLELIMEEL